MNKNKLKEYYDYLVAWVQQEVKKANLNGVVVGLSGGIDSSLVAYIAKKAFPENSLGIIMPINSIKKDSDDALKVVKDLQLDFEYIDLSETYKTMCKFLPVVDKLALANIKPRLRMTTLYSFAQEKKYLVLGTDNLAESYLGYFTKYGDGGVDLLPIVHLTKNEVREMAKLLNINDSIISKDPSAGLWEGQTDEAELGFTYNDFDQFIIDKNSLNEEIVKKIEKQHQITQHKRLEIPTPKPYNRN